MSSLPDLSRPVDPKFDRAVKSAARNVTSENFGEFCGKVLPHFRKHGLTQSTGDGILEAIATLISDPDNRNIFVEDYISALPFQRRRYADKCLDVLYLCAKERMKVSHGVIDGLKRFAQFESKKVVTIIWMISSAQDKPQDDLCGILISNSDDFINDDCIGQYVSLLVWLVENSRKFKKAHGSAIPPVLYKALQTVSNTNAKVCYSALCHVADLDIPLGDYNPGLVRRHIDDPSLERYVVSFMLRKLPFETGVVAAQRSDSDWLIRKLLHIASDPKSNAIMVILQLLENEDVARLVAGHTSYFMKGLPTWLDTLKVFTLVIKHQELRDVVLLKNGMDHVASFLLGVIDLDSDAILQSVCSIMKRLTMSKEFVQLLSRRCVVKKMFACAQKYNLVTEAMILLSVFGRHGYISDYSDLAGYIVDNVKEPKYEAYALHAAKLLSAYPKCCEKFNAMHLDRYVRENLKGKKTADRLYKSLRQGKREERARGGH